MVTSVDRDVGSFQAALHPRLSLTPSPSADNHHKPHSELWTGTQCFVLCFRLVFAGSIDGCLFNV